MKIRNSLGAAFLVTWVALLVLTACSSPVSAQGNPVTGFGREPRSGEGQGFGNSIRTGEQASRVVERRTLDRALDEVLAGELSDAEVEGLLYMREEEKLARDVYLALYEQWGMQVFSNIADSERTHMEVVKTLLDRYELEDPVEGKAAGEFANEELQALYNQLVGQGGQSLVEALQVGAAIEEIDILDLEGYVAQTDKADIQRVYENLTRGSRNHLRAFVSALERQGTTYKAAYLSLEAFDELLGSGTERGGGQEGGGGPGAVGRQGARGGQGSSGSRGSRGRQGK